MTTMTAESYYEAEIQRAAAGGYIPTGADDFKRVATLAIRSAVAAERERLIMVARRKVGDILRDES